MMPFRVFDRDKKEMWIVLNYHSSPDGQGSYLLAKEDDNELDGQLKIIPCEEIVRYHLVDMLDEMDDFS